jgi:hypothetical protein
MKYKSIQFKYPSIHPYPFTHFNIQLPIENDGIVLLEVESVRVLLVVAQSHNAHIVVVVIHRAVQKCCGSL